MPGTLQQRKLQLGREITKGTATAASTVWRGPAAGIADERETTFVTEQVGYLSPSNRSYVPRLQARYSMPDHEATFEQLPYILSASIQDVNSGTPDGSGSGYIYTYNFSTSAAKDIDTYTLEAGDNQQAEEMEHSYVESFTIGGPAGEGLMVSAEWVGRQVNTCAFTTGLSLPEVVEIIAGKGKLYYGAPTATYGGLDLLSASVIGATVNSNPGVRNVHSYDGNKYFNFAQIKAAPETTLEITFEHDGTGATVVNDWRDETTKKLKLQYEGPTLNTAGTSYTKKILKFEVPGKWESVSPLDESDGDDIRTATFRVLRYSTGNDAGKVVVVNELSALP